MLRKARAFDAATPCLTGDGDCYCPSSRGSQKKSSLVWLCIGCRCPSSYARRCLLRKTQQSLARVGRVATCLADCTEHAPQSPRLLWLGHCVSLGQLGAFAAHVVQNAACQRYSHILQTSQGWQRKLCIKFMPSCCSNFAAQRCRAECVDHRSLRPSFIRCS